MKIEIKSTIDNSVLFSHECEDNTIKRTVEAAVMAGVSLDYAKLNDAELNNATGNTDRTHCYQHGKYKLVIVDNVCHGGCTTMTCDEWLACNGAGLDEYDWNYLETITKPFIRMVKAIQGREG